MSVTGPDNRLKLADVLDLRDDIGQTLAHLVWPWLGGG